MEQTFHTENIPDAVTMLIMIKAEFKCGWPIVAGA
jgi:hypothetical protein